jgi:magnesium-transporting ATPase (P-type)
LVLSAETAEEAAAKLAEMAEAGAPAVSAALCAASALVVDGRSLSFCLEGASLDLFVQVAERCRSVICCRASPLQKASLVKVMRRKLGKVTLAVGDGANDVSMIQAANVGVGIMGHEGGQASRAADYAVSEFRYPLEESGSS